MLILSDRTKIAAMIKETKSDTVLGTFLKVASNTKAALEFIYQPKKYFYKNLFEQVKLEEKVLRNVVSRLKRRGLLEVSETNSGEIIVRLTKNGELRLIRGMLHSYQPQDSDKGFTVVIFDVPEKNRKARRMLRTELNFFGFKPIQKSVWISKKKPFEVLEKYLNLSGLNQYAVVIDAQEISINI